MPIPFVSSSSRNEIRDYLEFVGRVLEQHSSLDAIRGSATRIDFKTAATRVNQIRFRYEEPFRLAIVGEFKAGKSALINALLGRPGLVPEGATPTTGAITEIWWGEEERGEVFDGNGRPVFSGTVQDAMRFADQRSTEGKNVSGHGVRVVAYIASDFLRNLVILDTPGLGASAGDDKVTYDSLHLADAAILVVNGLQPGGEDSLSLSENLRVTQRKLLTVVTRIDRASNPVDALEAAKTLFGAVADGDPIGVASPVIGQALEALKAAEERRDQTGIIAANELLNSSGYFALRERLQESYFDGQAAVSRLSRTLADVRAMLNPLELQAGQELGSAQKKADELKSELSDAQRHVDEVLRPKIPFLEAKIDEAVDLHIGEFMSELGDAVDVFIDRLFDNKLGLGLQSIMAKFSKERKERQNAQLREEFRDLFPDEQLDMVVAQIGRTVHRVMELEWREILVAGSTPSDAKMFDPATLVSQICDHLAGLASAMAAEVAGMVALLFIPGGVIVDLVGIGLSLGVAAYVSKREPARVTRIKREAKIRLRVARRLLVEKLSKRFRKINSDAADELMARTTEAAAGKKKAQLDLLQVVKRWRSAHDELRRLIADCEDIAGEAGA